MKTAILIIVDVVDPTETAQGLDGITIMTENGDELHIESATVCPECDGYDRPAKP